MDNLERRQGVTISTEAAEIVARMLIEHRERAVRQAATLTANAKRRGHDIDTRIQYAEGAAAAYAVACSIVAGAAGVPSIDVLAGSDWSPPSDPLPPMLPDPDATAFAPGDPVAAATVMHNRAEITSRGAQAIEGEQP